MDRDGAMRTMQVAAAVETHGGPRFVLDMMSQGVGNERLSEMLNCTPLELVRWRSQTFTAQEIELAMQVRLDTIIDRALQSIATSTTVAEAQRATAMIKASLEVGQFTTTKYRAAKEKAQTAVILNADLTTLLGIDPAKAMDMKDVTPSSIMEQLSHANP